MTDKKYLNKIYKDLLWAGIEDSGLWMILQEVDSKYPEINSSDKKRLLGSLLDESVKSGYLKLYKLDKDNTSNIDLSSFETTEILNNLDEWWEKSKKTDSYRGFYATEEGKEYHDTLLKTINNQ